MTSLPASSASLKEIPFAAFFDDYQQLITLRLAPYSSALGETPIARIRSELIRQMSNLSFPLLYKLFDSRRLPLIDYSGLNLLALGPDSTSIYDSFIRDLRGADPQIVSLKSFLARALDRSLHGMEGLVKRLVADHVLIEAEFGSGGHLGSVIDLRFQMSDQHMRGSVVSVEYANGLRLIYKPKPLDSEVSFGTFLAWLEHRLSFGFKTPRVLNRGSYGYSEYVGSAPIPNEPSVTAFYQRLGALLAAAFVLNMSDLHFDNIIGHGEHPILIDLETILQPRRTTFKCDADRISSETVLQTGFLPSWVPNGAAKAISISAFGIDTDGFFIEEEVIRDLNSDAMVADRDRFLVPNSPVSKFDESPDALEWLIEGFTAALQCVRSDRTLLLSALSPLCDFEGIATRVVFRDTRLYNRLLKASLYANGADLFCLPSLLSRLRTFSQHMPDGQFKTFLIEREALALHDGAIPLFLTTSDDATSLCDEMEEHKTGFTCSGLDVARERIRHLSAHDIEIQVTLIRTSLEVHRLSNRRIYPIELPYSLDRDAPASYLEYAVEIGVHLCRDAIWGCDGSACWIGTAHVGDTGRWKLGPTDASLYDGTLGIGVFLAALSFVSGDRIFYNAAVGALKHSLKYVDATDSVGLGKGLASYVYALPLLCRFLKSDEWLPAGRSVLTSLGPRIQPKNIGLDVLNGAAGVALACSKWHEYTSDEDALQILRICAATIVERRDDVCRMSNNGFGHGFTGIDTALGRVKCARGLNVKMVPDGSMQSSPDNGAPRFPQTWCNGSIGAAFGDLSNISVSTRTVGECVDGGFYVDHVCCGLFGAVELLIESSQEARNNAPMEQARKLVARRLEGDTMRWVVIPGQTHVVPQPGFFQGVAGIGYSLLRLDRASELPCIMTFG
jgi:type 2 lantibiotic biosynthesis protein LanM